MISMVSCLSKQNKIYKYGLKFLLLLYKEPIFSSFKGQKQCTKTVHAQDQSRGITTFINQYYFGKDTSGLQHPSGLFLELNRSLSTDRLPHWALGWDVLKFGWARVAPMPRLKQLHRWASSPANHRAPHRNTLKNALICKPIKVVFDLVKEVPGSSKRRPVLISWTPVLISRTPFVQHRTL